MSVWKPPSDASVAAANNAPESAAPVLRELSQGITYQQEAQGGVLRDVETRRITQDEATTVPTGEHVVIVDNASSGETLTPAVNAGAGYAQPVNDGTIVAYGGDRPDVAFELGNFAVGGAFVPETQPTSSLVPTAVGSTDNIITLPDQGQSIENQAVGSVGLPDGGIGFFNGDTVEPLG